MVTTLAKQSYQELDAACSFLSCSRKCKDLSNLYLCKPCSPTGHLPPCNEFCEKLFDCTYWFMSLVVLILLTSLTSNTRWHYWLHRIG